MPYLRWIQRPTIWITAAALAVGLMTVGCETGDAPAGGHISLTAKPDTIGPIDDSTYIVAQVFDAGGQLVTVDVNLTLSADNGGFCTEHSNCQDSLFYLNPVLQVVAKGGVATAVLRSKGVSGGAVVVGAASGGINASDTVRLR